MTDLFVSYKAEDRARVAPLVQALQADGYSVWWDADIGGGEEWRDTICKQAKDDGRLPDGTSGFPGIPYVITDDKRVVVQPDSFELNRKIARALGTKSHDMCEGIK